MHKYLGQKGEINYLFDVDGTLTPARQQIDETFRQFFLEWIKDKNVFLVSGSDYGKTLEQVGQEVLESVTASFNSSGNVGYIQGQEFYRNEWNPPEELLNMLNSLLADSEYPNRTGNHIEIRIGMVNFSIVGRNATQDERKDYCEYDEGCQEREKLQSIIQDAFPELEVAIGGQISLDIYPKGKNKAQALQYMKGPVYFFGDKTLPGGNDYEIASKLLNPPHKIFQVNDWNETYQNLLNIVN